MCVCVCVCVKVSEEVLQEIKRAVLQKTVDGMREEGTPYVGEMTQTHTEPQINPIILLKRI